MFKTRSNNKLKLNIRTDKPGLLKDDIYGSIWHKLNDGIHNGSKPENIKHLADYIRSVDPTDEILTRFHEYQNQCISIQGEIRPNNERKLIFT